MKLSLIVAAAIMALSTSAFAQPTKKLQCIAASEEGQDLQKAGKLHDAEARFASCAVTACPAVVREDCNTKVTEIHARMPSVRFDVKDGAGNSVIGGVKIAIDGKPAEAANGSYDVDPGKHQVTFERAGAAPVTKEMTFVEGDRDRREVVSLGSAEEAKPSSSAPVALSSEESTTTNWPVYTAFGVAGVGAVVGIVGFIMERMQNATLAEQCKLPDNGCPRGTSQAAIDALSTDRMVMGIGFGVALLAAGTGMYLLLDKPSTKVGARVGAGYVGLEGRF